MSVQMDLMRRMAAGELSELFGIAAVDVDKARRLHHFRQHAQQILTQLTPFERQLLQAYTEGVNAGLKTLHTKPFEYLILREKPAAWQVVDCLLVGLGLFFELQDPMGDTTRLRSILKAHLPASVYDFLVQNGSAWDAPLDGSYQPIVPIPGSAHFQYLKHCQTSHLLPNVPPQSARGSNQWAVHAVHTKDKKALLACDMHLHLGVPNIWYRLGIDYKTDTGTPVHIQGISLPGTPLIAVGSNQHIAWGFTNAYVATTDLILLDCDPADPDSYLTPEGACPFEKRYGTINIKNKPPLRYQVRWTKWGPVHPRRLFNRQVVIRWIAHDLDCFNFRLLDLETSTSVIDALHTLPKIKLPALNFMVADQKGHIGWGLVGGIPKRKGYQPGLPISFTNGNYQWIGQWVDHPIIFDPPAGRLWTANNRVVSNPALGKEYVNPIRAYQIRQRLFASNQHTESDMYALQLDCRALLFDRWSQLLVDSLQLSNQNHKKLYSHIRAWDRHCSDASLGYFWIRTFRESVLQHIMTRLLSPCLSKYPDLNWHLIDWEEPAYLVASQKPAYLVDPAYGTWDNELTGIIDNMLATHAHLLEQQATWGQLNKAAIQHPLSGALSWIKSLLDMPKDPLAGDYYVPRVAAPAVGASMRMVVSPGNEAQGIFNMPCGQSGHPFSKHYRDQHSSWVHGIPTAFLPGPPIHQLNLVPSLKTPLNPV